MSDEKILKYGYNSNKWNRIPSISDVSWGKTKRETIKAWLQLFRAQTAPLTVIIVMAAYLHGGHFNLLSIITLSIILLFVHWISYGHNSLMDTVTGYDRVDPAKSHHPLVSGQISLESGHKVIHCSLIILSIITIVFTILFAENVILGLVAIILWTVLGQAYNDGMSKESLLAAPIISLMTCAMVAWGWFLSHETLDIVGMLYLIYIFLLIMFQISWDGSLKDIQMPEKSNILVRLGVRLEKRQTQMQRLFRKQYIVRMEDWIIIPKRAQRYAAILKIIPVLVACALAILQFDPFWGGIAFIWIALMALLSFAFYVDLMITKQWNRDEALSDMSYEQIFAIYLPIPLIMPFPWAIIFMVLGVLYFIKINEFLWETRHPRV